MIRRIRPIRLGSVPVWIHLNFFRNCLVQSRTYAETEGRDSEIAPTVGNSVETCNKLHYYELTYAL